MNWNEAFDMIEQFLIKLHEQVPIQAGQKHNFTLDEGTLCLNMYNDKDGQWHVFKSVDEGTEASLLSIIVELVMEGVQ